MEFYSGPDLTRTGSQSCSPDWKDESVAARSRPRSTGGAGDRRAVPAKGTTASRERSWLLAARAPRTLVAGSVIVFTTNSFDTRA